MLRKKILFGLVVLAVLAVGACKKAKENVIEDLMVKLITENVWVVTKFNVDGSPIVNDFTGYEFVFNKDNSVRAIKTGQPDVLGTWMGSEAGQSITSSFPTAGHPINKLNGVWEVTNTDLSPKLVDSHRFEGLTELVMRLNAK